MHVNIFIRRLADGIFFILWRPPLRLLEKVIFLESIKNQKRL